MQILSRFLTHNCILHFDGIRPVEIQSHKYHTRHVSPEYYWVRPQVVQLEEPDLLPDSSIQRHHIVSPSGAVTRPALFVPQLMVPDEYAQQQNQSIVGQTRLATEQLLTHKYIQKLFINTD